MSPRPRRTPPGSHARRTVSLRRGVLPALALVLLGTLVGAAGSLSGGARPVAVTDRAAAVRLASDARVWTAASAASATVRRVGVQDPVRVASFNVLGHGHTAPGGNKHGYAPGERRMVGAVRRLRHHGADLIGFQELQRPQKRAFRRLTRGAFAIFSGSADTDNSIAWRRSEYRLVAGTTQAIPYFHGRTRRMPVVLLRDRSTGQELYMMNVHNPARRASAHWRAVAVRRELALVRRLRTHGQPVLVTGDLNERDRAFCGLTRTGDLRTPAGGSHDGRCRPPSYAPVDWIFGSTGVGWSGFRIDRATRHRGISDHPMVVATAR